MLSKQVVKETSTIRIDIENSTKVKIEVESNTQGSLTLEVYGEGNLDLEVVFLDNSEWSYLFLNRSDLATKVEETVVLHTQANVHLNYAEFTTGKHGRNTNVNLVGERASVVSKGAVLCYKDLDWHIRANHLAKHTYALLKTSAILYSEANFKLEVTGYIEKGMSKSETHQFSKILNLGKNMEGVVYPKLLIDENDVAASHAASVGQPNPEELYYLQSRGLTRDKALHLIALGYLMPIVDDIEDEVIKENIRKEIETKVQI